MLALQPLRNHQPQSAHQSQERSAGRPPHLLGTAHPASALSRPAAEAGVGGAGEGPGVGGGDGGADEGEEAGMAGEAVGEVAGGLPVVDGVAVVVGDAAGVPWE